MHLPKWVGSLLKIGTSWIPGVGTAVEEGLDHLQGRQDRRSLLASLLDLEEQTWRPDASPAALLRADFGVVPFHAREAELQNLGRWCDSDRPLALRLYTAPGGFGKTRLLRHFVRIRRAEWDAGFLPEGILKDEAVSALLGEGKKPLLLVLDYAESRASEIATVLLAARDTPRPRVRMVLLARAEGDWWSELKRAGDGVGDFFQGPAVEGPLPLPPLTDSIDARRGSYQNAIHAFATVLGKETDADTFTDPSLDHEDFERVLLVHAAALAAVEGEQVPSNDLLDWLLTREERGIDRVREKQAGLGPEIQRATYHAAALVTLAQGADSRDETVAILSRASSLNDQPRARQEQIAEILHVLYRGRRWCDGVEPDLVGEHLVASCLRDAPELLEAAFGPRVPETQLETGLTVLNRLAQRRPADRWLLEEAIARGLRHLALPAVRAAVAGGDPVGFVLADALSRGAELEIARQVDEHLPYPTTALREVAAQVEEMLWRDLKNRAVEPVELARRSISLSTRLSDVGRHEEALEAIRKAVDTYRGLADAPPDEFRFELAFSLNNFSIRLAAVGRREEALETIREAVEIYRELTEAQPEAVRADLALSLNTLSNRLAALGRRGEGLEAIREAVEILRGLASARPDEFRPNLAASLNNLSSRLADLGHRMEALEAIREAVEIHHGLAKARPDAFRHTLAASLNNFSERLADSGRQEAALDAICEAVEIYRGLTEARPDAFRPDLATTLNNYSNRLGDFGRHEEALGAIREVVDIYRKLAEARPDAFTSDLAMSLNNLSNRLGGVGRHEEALEAIREAVVIRRSLAEARPDAFKPDLAGSLNNFSRRLSIVGQGEEALEAIREAVEIYRDLTEAQPDVFLDDLAKSLHNLSITLMGDDQRDEALQVIREVVEIRRKLTESHPDAFQSSLAMSLGVFQRLLRDAGEIEGALQAIKEAIDRLEPVFSRLPQAYATLMETVVGDYEETAAACGVEPDREQLHRIGKILAAVRGEDYASGSP